MASKNIIHENYIDIDIYQANCFDVFPTIKPKSVDLILSDFPYGTTNCKWDTPLDLAKIWQWYDVIAKDDCAILLFAQSPFDKVLGVSNLAMLRYEWIWRKTSATGHLNAKKMPLKAHENILVFYKKLPTYNPQKTFGHPRKVSNSKNRAACIARRNVTDTIYNKEYQNKVGGYNSTERYPVSVQTFKSDKQKQALHPTQKPLNLIKYLISTYSNEGDLILDNCAGSGTTAIGCLETGRKAIAIEKEKKHFLTMRSRLKNHILI